MERVESTGAWVIDGRVCNVLAVSRAFGDPEFKVGFDLGGLRGWGGQGFLWGGESEYCGSVKGAGSSRD